MYTRKWVNNLKIPMFCIDYGLAPECPYPTALDDCWQAYNWITSFVDRFFSNFFFLLIVNFLNVSYNKLFVVDIEPK